MSEVFEGETKFFYCSRFGSIANLKCRKVTLPNVVLPRTTNYRQYPNSDIVTQTELLKIQEASLASV